MKKLLSNVQVDNGKVYSQMINGDEIKVFHRIQKSNSNVINR